MKLFLVLDDVEQPEEEESDGLCACQFGTVLDQILIEQVLHLPPKIVDRAEPVAVLAFDEDVRQTSDCVAIGPIVLQHHPADPVLELLPQLPLVLGDVLVDGLEVQKLALSVVGLNGLQNLLLTMR